MSSVAMSAVAAPPVATMKGEGLVSDDPQRWDSEKLPVRYELTVWASESLPPGHHGAVAPTTTKIEGRLEGLTESERFTDQLLTLETHAGQRLRFYFTGPDGEIVVEDWDQ